MEAITITLDGVEVSGYAGMTVLNLARESGVDIPTLCHDPYLSLTGACRLCLVEEERSGALLAACVAPISPGMVINTRSARVLERRKVIIQLMLASHPDSCLVCDKGNRCQLRKLASEMGIGLVHLQKIPQTGVIEEVNPFIERDLSKCILCAKCIRACQELVVEGAIDYVGRGFTSKPTTLNDLPLEKSECTFCGSCVALCPTGALMEKESTYRGSTAVTVETVCPYCGCGCSLCLEVKGNQLVRARPARSPVNHATLCARGAYGYDFVHSPERLTSPLIKMNGSFQAASWEQALAQVSAQFRRIKQDYGSDSLAVLGSSKCTNEENYLLQRLARGVFGTNNIDNGSRLYSAASRVGLGWSIGYSGTTNMLADLEQSQVIMVIGADPISSAPAVGYAIKRAVRCQGARLLLVEPRETKLAPFASLWLRPKTGTDVTLVHGLVKLIIEEKLFDEEFVIRRTNNFDELQRSLKVYTLEQVEKTTGVNTRDMGLAARLFAGAESASIVYGTGITQYTNGTDSVMALANLAILTGNTGSHGGGIFALQRENNAQGACDMGSLPDFLPGYQSVDDSQASRKFEERWGVSLPGKPGLTALEMMEKARAGSVKGMLIVGENIVSSFPSPAFVKEALASLEFLAVADIFLTETAKLATVVLPAASFAEKEGTFTNFEGRVQRVRRAIEPFGNSMPDWEIILRLANNIGHPMPYSSPEEIMDEIEALVPLYQRPTYTGLEEGEREEAELERERFRMRRLHKEPFPTGFERFCPAEHTSPPNVSNKKYPFTLISGSILYQFGSGTRSLRASRLKKFSPNGWVQISVTDAEHLGFSGGDIVRVVSAAGEVSTSVRITDTLPPGMLFMPISFPESPSNQLFGEALDLKAKTPSTKACAVRLERLATSG